MAKLPPELAIQIWVKALSERWNLYFDESLMMKDAKLEADRILKEAEEKYGELLDERFSPTRPVKQTLDGYVCPVCGKQLKSGNSLHVCGLN